MLTIDFDAARKNMVDSQIRCCKILDSNVLHTFESLPRERFLPENIRSLAYIEGHVPLPEDQQMLTPLQEGIILQELSLQGTERILEIGTGCGFLTALMALHSKQIESIELNVSLAELAKSNLEAHGITNASIHCMNGLIEKNILPLGKFDVIVIGGCLRKLPDWFENILSPHGVIFAFIGEEPVIKLKNFSFLGKNLENTEITETIIQDMEQVPSKREFIF